MCPAGVVADGVCMAVNPGLEADGSAVSWVCVGGGEVLSVGAGERGTVKAAMGQAAMAQATVPNTANKAPHT